LLRPEVIIVTHVGGTARQFGPRDHASVRRRHTSPDDVIGVGVGGSETEASVGVVVEPVCARVADEFAI